jgi:hypothetical protein
MALLKVIQDLQQTYPDAPNLTALCYRQLENEYRLARKPVPDHGVLIRLAGERARPLAQQQAAADVQERRMRRGAQLSQNKLFGLPREVFGVSSDMPRRQRLARKDIQVMSASADLSEPLDLGAAETGRNSIEKALEILGDRIPDFKKLDRESQIAIASEILAAGGARKEDPDEPEEDLEDEEPFKSPSGLSSKRGLSSNSSEDTSIQYVEDLDRYPGARGIGGRLASAITALSERQPSFAALPWETQCTEAGAFVRGLASRSMR